jgi:hypothetical protein
MHLNARGELYVSGHNIPGELGLGDTTHRAAWTYNNRVPRATAVSGGVFHSLFADVYGNLLACGQGVFGQLGHGTSGTAANKNLPTYVPGAPFATAVAGGGYHSLILTTPKVQLASVTISPTSVMAGNSATGTVTLTELAGPGGQRVYLSWNNSNAATMPAYVDVAPTSRTAAFTISTNRLLGAMTVVTVNAYLDRQASATLTIHPWVFQQ